MPRRLKTFRTHIGFYDLVIAAPSMKSAAAAWGTSSRVFSQGFAEETRDADAVAAAMAHPGIVLKRPFGTGGAFKAEPDRIPAPRVSKRQNENAAKARAAKKREAVAAKRAEAAARQKARRNAEAELADIAREERELRDRRQSLHRKFHLRGV
jgi:colicin import membrane protein